MTNPKERLEYLRGELRASCLSWGEVLELQELIPHIDSGDVELLEAAGVPEFPVDDDERSDFQRELKTLLKKYDSEIELIPNPGMDDHGLYDSTMVVVNSFGEKLVSVKGISITANDL